MSVTHTHAHTHTQASDSIYSHCLVDEGVAGKVEQDGAPPTMYGVAITHTGVYNIVRMFPTDNFVSAGLLAR